MKRKANLVEDYLKREVIYLLGENANLENIDQDCPARFQGRNRLERGENFKMVLDQEFPNHGHSIFTIPGVGHTQWGMYSSEVGKKLLYQ
jgi:hypothetical protein